MSVRGRDMVTGLPNTIEMTSTEIYKAIKPSLDKILEGIRLTLENCPPELSGDIVDQGIIITGGGALLNSLKDCLSEKMFVPVTMQKIPLKSVAIGTGLTLKLITQLQKP